MDLIPIAVPAILPPFVESVAVRLSGPDPGGQFDAGRTCAREALRRLRPDLADATVARGDAGRPIWPAGVTGSITHTRELAWAAVALTTQAASLGIDFEPVRSPERAARVTDVVLVSGEDPPDDAFTTAEWVALVLSIKESVFKCLYPLVGRRFYFDAMRVTTVDRTAGTFGGVLLTSLSPSFVAGRELTGRFTLDEGGAATAIVLPGEDVARLAD